MKSPVLKMRSILLSAGAALVLCGGASAETLSGAMTSAYNNSNLLDQQRAILRAQDENIAVAQSALRPQISGQASVANSDRASNLPGGTLSQTISIGVDLLLYDGGATQLAVESAKETVLAARHQLLAQEQQVLFNAVQAYISVLRDARVVSLRDTNQRLITQELRAARDRFEVGEVTRTDVAQAEARLAAARGTAADARGNLQISQQLYQAAVGQLPSQLQPVGHLPKLPASLDAAVNLGTAQSPSIRQAQSEVKANELNAQRAEANIKPRLSLNGSVGHNSTIDNNSSVGLQLNVPIYQGGQLSALRRRALANVHASKANLNQQVVLTRQNVSDAWANLSVARAQVTASDRQISAAQVAFDGVREEAKLGSRTTLDVLDAEQALADARTNRVVSETQVYAAAYQLMVATGQLTAEKLGLPVERYDPSEYYNAVKGAPVRVSKQGQKLDRILQRYDD